MLIELDSKLAENLFSEAIASAGSERKLSKKLGISATSIYYYKKCIRRMSYSTFKKLLSFLKKKEKEIEFRKIDESEYLSKGGKITYKKFLDSGRFKEVHKKMRKASSERMKKLHEKHKSENKEKYYKTQYEYFKKIGNYKFNTKNNEKVRNHLEKEVADLLYSLSIEYEYEPYVDCETKCYFPDFKIKNLVIECTAWKGFQKAYSLKNKIEDFEAHGLKVKVIVPDDLRRFYKPIEKYIMNTSELKEFLCPCSSDRVWF